MDFLKKYNSPLGKIVLTSDGESLTGLYFDNSKVMAKHNFKYTEKSLPIFDETIKWLDIYFKGEEPNFTPKYKVNNLTPFRKLVIEFLEKIPYGKTVTYKEIAEHIAKIKGIKKMSAQAVGGAVGWNPICIIIPCHRVVGSNGSLVGYGGGMENKIELLKTEKVNMSKFCLK